MTGYCSMVAITLSSVRPDEHSLSMKLTSLSLSNNFIPHVLARFLSGREIIN